MTNNFEPMAWPIRRPLTHEEAVDVLRLMSQAPGFAATWRVRHILPVQGYASPLLMPVAYVDHAMLNSDIGKLDGCDANTLVGACWLAMHYWPTYFVSEALVDALINTNPPEDLRWADLRWPIPAALFVLPDTKELRDHFICAAGVPSLATMKVQRPPANQPVTLMGLLERIKMPGQKDKGEWIERAMVQALYFDTDNGRIVWQDLCCRPEWTLAESCSQKGYEGEGPNPSRRFFNVDVDIERSRRFTQLTVNLLTYMASERVAGTIVMGELLRKAKTKGERVVPELWSPNWIGKDYVRRVHTGPGVSGGAVGGGTHASPRTHWRRGHFSRRHVGVGRLEIRIVWIEPVLVNAADRTDNKETSSIT
jgi:hypothetical protein